MKYMVLAEQYGYGCDYTIGCGKTFYQVEADSIDEVMEKIAFPEGKEEPYCSQLRGDNELESVTIIPCDGMVKVDLAPWKEKVQKNIDAYESIKQKKKDLEEFERLKQKLGK